VASAATGAGITDYQPTGEFSEAERAWAHQVRTRSAWTLQARGY
jgi:hypothetical protein